MTVVRPCVGHTLSTGPWAGQTTQSGAWTLRVICPGEGPACAGEVPASYSCIMRAEKGRIDMRASCAREGRVGGRCSAKNVVEGDTWFQSPSSEEEGASSGTPASEGGASSGMPASEGGASWEGSGTWECSGLLVPGAPRVSRRPSSTRVGPVSTTTDTHAIFYQNTHL